jgi:DNA-binding response OmpR family regulator
VTAQSLPKNILVVDDDLGFMAMLCLKLTDAGFVTVPASVSEQALPLLKEMEISRVDLLIVNLAVPGTKDLIQLLRAENERLKIIAIDDPRAAPLTTAAIEGVIRKPSGVEQPSEREWLQVLERVLAVE